MKTIITFQAFMLSKGIVDSAKLHPNEMAMWRTAYETEVPADLRETVQESRTVGGGPDELQLKAEPGNSDEVFLQAACELTGDPAGMVIEAAAGEAKLPTFSMTAYNGGPMYPGGWYENDPIIIDLAGMEISQSLPVDAGHYEDVGHTTSIEKAVKSLKASGILSAYTPEVGEQDGSAIAARRIVRMGANGFPFQASIAPSVLRSKIELVLAGETARVNGRSFPGPVHVARRSTLKKIAILSLGADSTTSTTVAASFQKGQQMNPFDTWLVSNDFDPAIVNANAKMKTKLEAQYKAETAPQPAPVPTQATKVEGQTAFDQKMEAIEQENHRIEHIRDRTAVHAASHVGNQAKVKELRELCAAAIEDKTMTPLKFDLAMERASRANVPMMFATKQPQLNDTVIEAALCKHAGLPDREKYFKPDILEAADKHFRGGITLLGAIDLAARSNGWRGQSVKTDLKRALRAAFRENDGYADVHASVGPSTYSIGSVLSNTANLHIRAAFSAVEAEWRKIAFISSVTDYREIVTAQLTGDFTYKKVPRGGEVKHAKFGDETYGNKADLHAILIGIDEQDLVDDSLRALTSMSRMIGRGGALAMNDVIWAEWLDDAAFFPTDKSLGNYDDGAVDSMLTAAGLTNMNSIFRAQTDFDGKPLGLRPRILLVPPALEGAALTLMSSEFAATTGEANIWRNRFVVVSSDYLTNPFAWYLVANPQDLPAIEMVFLNGQEMPETEQADMAIDRLGIVIRGKHSFGARKQSHKAANKAKGAA